MQNIRGACTRVVSTLLNGIEHAEQGKIKDCYLPSSIKALYHNDFRKSKLPVLLKTATNSNYIVTFHHKNRKLPYIVNNEDLERLEFKEYSPTKVIKIIEIATTKLFKDNPLLKILKPNKLNNWVVTSPLDYFQAGKYLELLTGDKPLNIGESNLNTLSAPLNKLEKNLVSEVFNLISEKNKKFSLLASSYINLGKALINRQNYNFIKTSENKMPRIVNKDDIIFAHYYIIRDINKGSKQLTLEDPHNPKDLIEIPYEKFFNNFRSIVGYID